MSDGNLNLSSLREEIDSIDEQLHDLIVRRADIAVAVRSSKGNSSFWRPAREAQILRRLIARHKGPFPKSTIVQLWREIVSAMVRIQGELKVAVYAPDGIYICKEIARDHFGAGTPLSLHSSARAVLNSVQNGEVTVGILPFPEDEKRQLVDTLATMETERRLSVCARLPFVPMAVDHRDAALCVAKIEAENSGDDKSFFVLHTLLKLGRTRLQEAITAAGITLLRLVGINEQLEDNTMFLLELEGFIEPDDARIAHLTNPDHGVAKDAFFLGVYATFSSENHLEYGRALMVLVPRPGIK